MVKKPITLLSIQSISKSYNNVVVNNKISFNINNGTKFGLLGPNGAGKTTLIRMLTQIIYPDSGSFTVNGTPVTNKHARLFGYMPEERGLYKQMKVYEHLIYLARLKGLNKVEAKQAVLHWFDRFDIHDWKNKKLEELSKGMQQKVQFIATVCHNPQIIILDEPFSGLDPVNTQIIRKEIERLNQNGATIIFSTHRMEQVEELCEEIAILNHGNLVLNGNVKSVKQQFKDNQFKLITNQAINPEAIANFGYIEHQNKNEYIIKLKPEKTSNNLLQTVLKQGLTVTHFEEILPSLNHIFIKLIKQQTQPLTHA